MGQAAGGWDKALRFICAGERVLVRGRASVALGGVGLRDVGEAGVLLTSAQKLWERGGGGGGRGMDLGGNRIGGGLV